MRSQRRSAGAIRPSLAWILGAAAFAVGLAATVWLGLERPLADTSEPDASRAAGEGAVAGSSQGKGVRGTPAPSGARATTPSAAAAAGSAPVGAPGAAEATARAGEDRVVALRASELPGDQPVRLDFPLGVEERGGAELVEAVLRSESGENRRLQLRIDSASGAARLAIAAAELPPGSYLLEIETATRSWNPRKRFRIDVEE